MTLSNCPTPPQMGTPAASHGAQAMAYHVAFPPGHAGQSHLVVSDPALGLEHADAPERFLHEKPHLRNAVGQQVLEFDVPGHFRRAPAVAALGRDGEGDVASPRQFPGPAIERRLIRTVLVEPFEGHALGRPARPRHADHAREVFGRMVQGLDQDGRDRLAVRIGICKTREPDVVFLPRITCGEIDLPGISAMPKSSSSLSRVFSGGIDSGNRGRRPLRS